MRVSFSSRSVCARLEERSPDGLYSHRRRGCGAGQAGQRRREPDAAHHRVRTRGARLPRRESRHLRVTARLRAFHRYPLLSLCSGPQVPAPLTSQVPAPFNVFRSKGTRASLSPFRSIGTCFFHSVQVHRYPLFSLHRYPFLLLFICESRKTPLEASLPLVPTCVHIPQLSSFVCTPGIQLCTHISHTRCSLQGSSSRWCRC